MKRLLPFLLFLFLMKTGFAQEADKLVGFWEFSKVSSTDPDCKDVSYFPIYSFDFNKDGSAEFKTEEGTANAKYKVSKNLIVLTDLSENGVKQDGSAQFHVKEVSDTSLILKVEYECGSIDIFFKK